MNITTKTEAFTGTANRVGYAAGNYGKSLIWISLDYFLLFFLTDLWGLTPVQAGVVVILALVWDGLWGPVVGYVIDKTTTPMGQYGPYLVFGAPLCAASFWLLLYEPGWRGDGLVLYALFVGLLSRTAYTICDVPHNALLARLSQGEGEAATLTGLRLIFSALGGLTVAYAAGIAFAVPDPVAQGSRISDFAVWAGVGYVAALWVSWLATRHIDRPRPIRRQSPGARFASLRRSSMLGLLLAIAFVQVATLSVFNRSIAYFGDSVLGDETWASRALVLITIAQGLSMPFWIAVTQRFDKRQVLLFAYGALSVLLVLFILWGQSLAWARLPLVGLIGAAMGGCGFAIWAMLPDVIDHGQWRGGLRAEALSTALFLLVLKCASGLSAMLLSLPLWLIGYDSQVSGDPVTARLIVMTMGLFPIGGIAICILALRSYDLGRRRHADIARALSTVRD